MKRKTIVTVFFTLTALLLSGGKAEGQQQETLARSSSPTARYAAEETGLPAAAPWTLQECIRYAQENNIEIQRQELSIEDAELARKQTRLNYIPSVSASVGSGTSFGRVLDPTTYEFRENSSNTDLSASLSLGTEVFAGMRKYHQLKKSDLALQDMLLQVDKARNDLSLNITAAYLDVLFAEEQVTIASQRTRTLTLQVEQTQMLVESGRKTMGDLLQLQADLADAQFQDKCLRRPCNIYRVKYICYSHSNRAGQSSVPAPENQSCQHAECISHMEGRRSSSGQRYLYL